MLDKKVTKLWQGRFVSIRDYESELKNIQNNIPFNNPPIKSKTGGKNYRLVDIPWKPAQPENGQKELF